MSNKRKRNKLGQFTNDLRASNTSEYGFVNLSTYTSPEIKEFKNKEWVAYGADNNYFQFLIDRYNGSPTNNAAINGISQAIYGKGLNATDSNRKPDEYAQMISLFHKDCVRKLCYDLKLMGQCALQVIYSKDRSKIAQLEHFPIETLRAEKANDNGDIPAYYYFKDWTEIKPSDKPLRIPAFGMSKENIEIMYVQPYRAGFYYYSPVDYQGGLQYAELEEEISNFHLNNILNGLSPSMLINFNNGTPNQEERRLIENKIAQKFSGSSNAGKFILAFNDNKEAAADITPIQLSDAHNQYQFLSDESSKKIMVAHRIVSPMLLGIKDGSGLGNNADEIKTASLLMDNTVIRPFQELLIDSFDKLLAYNDISLSLYFTTLQPLEFTEVDSNVQDKESIEEETGVEMETKLKEPCWDGYEQIGMKMKNGKKVPNCVPVENSKENLKIIDGKSAYETAEEAIAIADSLGCQGYHEHEDEGRTWYMPCSNHEEFERPKLSDEAGDVLLNALEGEKVTDEWIEVDSLDEEKSISDEDWANICIKEKKGFLAKLKDEIYSKRNGSAFSYLDSKNYKIRYKYAVGSRKPNEEGNKSRTFCQNMMRLSKDGIVYRLEDIDRATRLGVNKTLGHKGKAYDLFKFKGGIYCRHKWVRVLYRLESNTEPSDNLKAYKKTRSIPSSYIKKPRGTKESMIAPENMKNRGAYPK